MNAETLMIIVASGLMITEIILIISVVRLTRQMKNLNSRLNDTVDVIASKLHLIVDKINFDIPKIMETGLQYVKLFKSGQ